MSESSQTVNIRSTTNDGELRSCAAMMAASEPWLTLRRDADCLFQRLTAPGCEVLVARVGTALGGAVAIDMQGAFAGYIAVLAVAPEWRGQKIGEQLLGSAEQRIFRDSPNVFLCVSDFNIRAQKFYARLGYERIGELKNYAAAGKSEFLLRKTIGPKDGFEGRSRR